MRPTINHVALAVPSLERFLARTAPLYGGLDLGAPIVNPRQQVTERFLTDGKTVIELLEPIGASSPVSAFLGRNPRGGLIHLALDVDEIAPVVAQVVAAGGKQVVDPVPDVAFGGRRIAFVYLDGHLTELIERRVV